MLDVLCPQGCQRFNIMWFCGFREPSKEKIPIIRLKMLFSPVLSRFLVAYNHYKKACSLKFSTTLFPVLGGEVLYFGGLFSQLLL